MDDWFEDTVYSSLNLSEAMFDDDEDKLFSLLEDAYGGKSKVANYIDISNFNNWPEW